jgi:UDP-N-acetylmuramate--L-alanine ligase (EC 6.3.2.8)
MKAYFIGIGGIGMSGVAALAKRLGYEVSGSDKLPLYPPASEILEKEGIPIFEPKNENIKLFNPDLVIVGNAVKRDHPEVEGKP